MDVLVALMLSPAQAGPTRYVSPAIIVFPVILFFCWLVAALLSARIREGSVAFAWGAVGWSLLVLLATAGVALVELAGLFVDPKMVGPRTSGVTFVVVVGATHLAMLVYGIRVGALRGRTCATSDAELDLNSLPRRAGMLRIFTPMGWALLGLNGIYLLLACLIPQSEVRWGPRLLMADAVLGMLFGWRVLAVRRTWDNKRALRLYELSVYSMLFSFIAWGIFTYQWQTAESRIIRTSWLFAGLLSLLWRIVQVWLVRVLSPKGFMG
jgi:hypothetical protein